MLEMVGVINPSRMWAIIWSYTMLAIFTKDNYYSYNTIKQRTRWRNACYNLFDEKQSYKVEFITPHDPNNNPHYVP